MPLIRYRTGDLARLLPGTCACGSELVRLDKVRSRLSAVRRLRNGRSLALPELDEVLLRPECMLDYTAALEDCASGDRLRLRLAVPKGEENCAVRAASLALQHLPSLHDVELAISAAPWNAANVSPAKRLLKDDREHHELAARH